MALETQRDTKYMQNKEDQKLTHSFVPNDPSWMKEIEGPNQRDKIKKMYATPSPIKVLIYNRNNSRGRSYDKKKILKKESIFNKT